MRVLIYSETEAAKKRLAELRDEGHHASLRNPQYFNPEQFDKSCNLAIADDPVILASYSEADIPTERLTSEEVEGKPGAPAATATPEKTAATEKPDKPPKSAAAAGADKPATGKPKTTRTRTEANK